MRISSSSGMQRSSSNPGKKAALRKQIRKLEKEKKEVMKKLGMGDGMKSENVVKSAMALHMQSGSAQASTTASTEQQSTVSVGENGSVNIQAPSTPIPEQNTAPASSGGEGGGEAQQEDPKELMKKLVLLEMQIMELKKQLGDDSSVNTNDDDDDDEGESQAGAAPPAADDTVAEPAGDGGGEVHVDEYA